MKRNPPHEPETIDSVERIIQATMRVFSRKPLDCVTLNMIAREADAKVPLLVYHFRSKADLYRLALERSLAFLAKQTRSYYELLGDRGTFTPEEGAMVLYALIDNFMDGMYGSRPMESTSQKIIYLRLLYPPRDIKAPYEEEFHKYGDLWVHVLQGVTGIDDRDRLLDYMAVIFGQMSGFHFVRDILARLIGFQDFHRTEQETLKSIVLRNTSTILGSRVFDRYLDRILVTETSRSLRSGPGNDVDDSIESVRRILEAATRIFALHPLEEVSLNAIATEADVKPTLILHHFKSKSNLYRIVLERAMTVREERLETVYGAAQYKIPEEEAVRIYYRMIDRIMNGMYRLDQVGYYHEKLIVNELLLPSEFSESLCRKYLCKQFEFLASLVQCIAGHFDREQSFLQAAAVFGMMFGFHIEQKMFLRSTEKNTWSEEEVGQLKSFVIRHALSILEKSPSGAGETEEDRTSKRNR